MEGLQTKVAAVGTHVQHASYSEATNTLILQKAADFEYSITEYEEESKAINTEIAKLKKAIEHSWQILHNDAASLNTTYNKWDTLNAAQRKAYTDDLKIYEQNKKNNDELQKINAQKIKNREAKLAALKERYSDIYWIWNVVYEDMHFGKEDFTLEGRTPVRLFVHFQRCWKVA